jgi:hypothetical protein
VLREKGRKEGEERESGGERPEQSAKSLQEGGKKSIEAEVL